MSEDKDETRVAREAALERLRREAGVPLADAGPAPADVETEAGLATRAVAFAVDAAVVNGVAVVVAVAGGLALSILHLPSNLDAVIVAIGGVVWIGWTIGYFVLFWSTTGQTPGDRLMHIQVIGAGNRLPIKPVRAAVRVGGVVLAVLPLGAGIWMMLWDDRRRCFQDRLAHTLVMYTASTPPIVKSWRRPVRSTAVPSAPRALMPGPPGAPAPGGQNGASDAARAGHGDGSAVSG